MLWTASEAAVATGGQTTGDWAATGVSIDSRTVARGDLFVALTAARDGHDFVGDALQAGAAAAMVTHRPEGVQADAPLLIVDDVQAALEALGTAGRARFGGKVVAITGSVGKTSTKEMLREVLGAHGRVHAAEKSYNNHWGVPLTLARMPRDADFAVIEIGMNAPGEIAPLARMAAPHVAMVTIVAPAHLAAFESLEGIAREKGSIFEGLVPGGVAVLNADLGVSGILREAAEGAGLVLGFGQSEAADYRLREVAIGDRVTVVKGLAGDTEVLYKVAVPGRHFATNAIATLAVTDALGLDRAISTGALGRWSPVAGRGAREVITLDPVETEMTVELIDDAYNANPASVAAALEVLAGAVPRHDIGRVSKGRRIAYLGDMMELGRTEVALHAALADHPGMARIDKVHCVGPLMRHLWEALPEAQRGRWCETAAEMAKGVARDLDAGDVVLAKGSLSMGVGRVVDAIRKMHKPPLGGED